MIRKPNFKLNWKYALGELFLIFLGISLAITFQNWNEERKKTGLEKVYLSELLDDCKRDSASLASYVMLSEGKYKDGKMVEKALLTGKLNYDSAAFISRLFFTGRYLEYSPYFPTYDELISTGNLNIITSRKLKDDIRKFIQRSRHDQTFWATEFRKRKEEYNNHLFLYFDAEIMPMLWELPTIAGPNGLDKAVNSENLIEPFRTDLNGFMRDPKSLLVVEKIKGVDRELARTYESDLLNLAQIIDLITSELVD